MATGKAITAGANMNIAGTGITTAIIAITTGVSVQSLKDPRRDSGAQARRHQAATWCSQNRRDRRSL